ncbi:hypothetical protein FACS189450_15360 [Spirochaetia bacterium]|nr:hypothetical protein FACS189450_15360 [Spirochaetia bacterium]
MRFFFPDYSKTFFVITGTKKLNQHIVLRFISLSIAGYFRWPFLRKADIAGQDHLLFSPYIIGKRNYTYIEDAPHIFKIYLHEKLYQDRCAFWADKRFFLKKLLNYIISDVYNRPVANNKQCKALILTEDDDAPYIAGKTKQIVPLETMWKNASTEKRKYILDIYGLSGIDISALQKKTHIILTQQFSADGFISEEEQIELYGTIIKQYDPSCLVIKTHPRDLINYRKYFSDVYVFDKIIPMQLLVLTGVKFSKAITIFSSSINSFPYELEKEWIGSSIHPSLYERYPNLVHNI